MTSITVSPANANTVIAGANNGGLWRSTDASQATWTQLSSLMNAVHDVRFSPTNANVLIATAAIDTRLRTATGGTPENGGGIWRSLDGGNTWTRPANVAPPCAGGKPVGAYGIAWAPDVNRVYIGTDCDVTIGNNVGVAGESWTHTVVDPTKTVAVISVTAAAAGVIDIHTTDGRGHFRSTNSGGSFTARCTDAVTNKTGIAPPDGLCDQGLPPAKGNFEGVSNHSIARAGNADVLFGSAFDPSAGRHMLFESDNQGATWIKLNPPAEPSAGNRVPFVFTYQNATPALVVVYCDGMGMSTQICNLTTGTRCNPLATSWTASTLPHTDLTDVAMSPTGTRCPLFMTGDGGVMKSANCGSSWSMISAGAAGIKALEMIEMTGQVHPAVAPNPALKTDLYFATQDNEIWGSTDSAVTWPGHVAWEGGGLQVTHSSPSRTGVIVTGVACGGCDRFKAGAGLIGSTSDWIDPANDACPDINQDGSCDACVNPVNMTLPDGVHRVCNSPAGAASCTTNAQCTAPAVCVKLPPALPASTGACGVDVVNNKTYLPPADGVIDGPITCWDDNSNGTCDGRACLDRRNIVDDPGPDRRCDRRGAGEAAITPRIIDTNIYAQWDEGGFTTHRGGAAGALGGACDCTAGCLAPQVNCNAVDLTCVAKICERVFPYTLYLTTNANAVTPTWTTTGATFGAGDPTRSITDNGQISGPIANPSLFQPVWADTNATYGGEPTFIEVKGVRSGAATINTGYFARFPFMAFSPGMWRGEYRGVAADPRNANNVVAANFVWRLDAAGATVPGTDVSVTHDGGTTWTLLPQVEKLLGAGSATAATPNAKYSLSVSTTGNTWFTQVTTVAFDPANSQRILIGTQNAGMLSSLDGGTSWARMCKSDQVPRVTSFFFDEVEAKVYASSYGRGLWQVFPSRQQVPTFTTAPTNKPASDCVNVDVGTPVAEDQCEGLPVTISNSVCGTTNFTSCGPFVRNANPLKWTAEDAAGDTTVSNVTITVTDTTGPTGAFAPPPIVLTSNVNVTFADLDPNTLRSAYDGCQGAIPPSQWRTVPALNALAYGKNDVSWYPRDDLGNEGAPVTQQVLILGGDAKYAGDGFSCELSPLGEVTCWGLGANGRLGDGTINTRFSPGPTTLANVAQLSVGKTHACAVKTDGTVWCWGQNDHGKLGNGSIFDSALPVQVVGLTGVRQVSAGAMHSCAVTTAGALYCWGENDDGRLGVFGLFLDQLLPVLVPGITNVQQVSAGLDHTCAIKNDGTLWCWGENNDGRLGLGTIPFDQQVPAQVPGLTNVRQVSTGDAHTCAVNAAHQLYCWGEFANGRLGIGLVLIDQGLPVLVSTPTGVIQVSAGAAHTCAVYDSGQVACWGAFTEGRLGIGLTLLDAITPTVVPGISNAVQVSAGAAHTCAILENDDRVCWGDNLFGQIGDGTAVDRLSTQQSAGLCDASAVEVGKDFGCALGLDQGFPVDYCWGTNFFGQVGAGEVGDRFAPWRVTGPVLVTDISAGDEDACAVTAFGQLYCWGLNVDARLGDGTLISRNAPTQVFTNLPPAPNPACNYREQNGKAYYFCSNDLLWSSARDACHNVGMELARIDDATENALVQSYIVGPTWIGGNDRTQEAIWRWAEAGGDNGPQFWNGGAPAVGGTPLLYANWNGLLEPNPEDCARIDTNGLWTATNCTAVPTDYVCEGPVSVFPDTRDVAAGQTHTCAVNVSGQVQCWGSNVHGMLGDGTLVARAVPTRVVGLPGTAQQVAAGDTHTCALVQNGANKEVYCWGDGTSGRLGRNSLTDSSAPVKVQGLTTDVVELSVGGAHSCVRTATGKVYCWGENDFGRLGLGNTVDRLTAVQVLRSGASLNALAISAGKEHTCAAMSDGTALCWGRNNGAQLGDNTIIDRFVPTQVVGMTNAQTISAGTDHSCATRAVGTEREVWCWGNNAQGELGTGTLVSSAVPVKTGGSSCAVF